MAAAGGLGHGVPLGNQQQRLDPAIHTRLTGGLERRRQPLAIRTAESHPMAPIRSSHAPEREYPAMACKTYGYLLSSSLHVP